MGQILRYLRRIDRYINRKRLKNRSFSIVTNNCIGGVISHDLHLRFLSPTVNLFFENEDFIVFCEHLEYYLSLPVIEMQTDRLYPVGVLKGKYGSVKVYFMHYSGFEEAAAKWEQRSRRVDYSNLFVIMEAQRCTKELLDRFDALPFPHKVVLVAECDSRPKCSFPIKNSFYEDGYFPGKLLSYPKWGLRRYLDSFDYVTFFNEGVIRKRYV